jgi:hypothetical protein
MGAKEFCSIKTFGMKYKEKKYIKSRQEGLKKLLII